MYNVLAVGMPDKTYMRSVSSWLQHQFDKVSERIDNFQAGLPGSYMLIGDTFVLSEDYNRHVYGDYDYDSLVPGVKIDGTDTSILVSTISSTLGDELVCADAFKEAMISIGNNLEGNINDAVNRIRQFIANKYGTISGACQRYLDVLSNVLDQNTSPVDKFKQLFNLHRGTTSTTGFQSEIGEYTGVNPWVAYFSAPWPEWTNVGQAVIDLFKWQFNFMNKVQATFRNVAKNLFSGIVHWFTIQVNPFDLAPNDNYQDYSLDTSYWSKLLTYSDHSSDTTFNAVYDYLKDHGYSCLCIPTLGSTVYLTLQSGSIEDPTNGGILVYIKKHVYNYSASRELSRLTGLTRGSTILGTDSWAESWNKDCAGLSTLAPTIDSGRDNAENDLFNGMLQAEYLMHLGFRLISGDDTVISQCLEYDYATARSNPKWRKWISQGYSPNVYFANQVTNLDWKNEYEYGDADDTYIINTILSSVVTGIINNDEIFVPYSWTSGQLVGCAKIKTDRMNDADMRSTLRVIVIASVAITTAVLIGVGMGKLKQAAFDATRRADLAAFDMNVSNREARKLARKASLLTSLAGTASTATASTIPAAYSFWSDYNHNDALIRTNSDSVYSRLNSLDGSMGSTDDKVNDTLTALRSILNKLGNDPRAIDALILQVKNLIYSD